MSISRILRWLRRCVYIPIVLVTLYLFNWLQKSVGSQIMKRKHFVGLKNQGATCYLNTLLQTWFMTQEVKECITNYKEQDSLICELRSLFERLSNGKERSLSTVQLTSQLKLNVHEQRDIEECFRSLVNKLNSKVDQEHNILKIYQVTMFNSLKCLKCAKSMDEDTVFLDIPLSVCSANAAEKFDSMEKSLEQFLKEEKMEGDNKCYCTNCEMKTETSSRYYFKHLPQILTFQLKRFEFDYNYMAFQKITDCITVPPVLEFTRSQTQLNNARNNCHVDFVEENVTPVQHQEVNQEDSEVFTGRNPETPQDHSQQVSTGQEVNNAENHWHLVIEKDGDTADQYQEVNQEDSEVFTGRNPATPQDHSQKVSTGQEEKKYELFAIWHHSGIYGSGHYYAEIKSKSGDWYNFNDENVKKENINLSSKTAYMLMYRLTDTKLKAEARLREQRQEDAYAGGKRRREEANANEGHGGGKRRREEEEQKARHDGVESQGIPDV